MKQRRGTQGRNNNNNDGGGGSGFFFFFFALALESVMGTERDRYPAAERTAQPGTLQKLKNNGAAGGEARSRGGSGKAEQTHAGCDQSQGCYLMRVCILSCLSESWFFLDQRGCTEESRAGAGRRGGGRTSVIGATHRWERDNGRNTWSPAPEP